MSTTTQPTKQQALVSALRTLADTIEQHDLQITGFANVAFGKVHIGSDDFENLFQGKSVRGKRQGSMLTVEAEYAGIVFATNLFPPEENSGFETVLIGS